MKQIFSTNDGLHTFDAPIPTPGEREILVAVYTSVISTGTETMSMKKGDITLSEKILEKKVLLDKVQNMVRNKGLNESIKIIKNRLNLKEQERLFKPVGYSNSGIIVEKGRLVTNFNVGDRVACAGAGIASHAEFVAVPVNLAVKIPDEVTYDSAGFTTIGAIAMQGIRRANVTFGETIVITGLGLLGLIAVQIAKAWGLVVIGIDVNNKRLDLAKDLGADYCISASDNMLVHKIKTVTNGYGADAIIIYAATKRSEPANQALEACRSKGRVVIVGSVGMNLQRDAMYAKELDFVMSTSYGPGRYDNQYELKGIDYPIGYVRWTENRNMMEFIRLLAKGQVKVDKLISNRFNINQAEEAYNVLIESSSDNVANIFCYHHDINQLPVSRLDVQTSKTVSEKITVGIIGAGSFIQANHLANILSMPDIYELTAIAERTSASAKTISEKYKPKYVTTDYRQLLQDPDINLIIIGTRHNLHATLVIEAINSGKNVFVEKPLAMTFEELALIREAYARNPNVHAIVGFNRRYSPFAQKIREKITRKGTPVVINYRVNAGHIEPEAWVQDLEEGGGRIVGEVCHFIDLITYMAGGNVLNMSAIHIPADLKIIKSEDNIIVTLAFDNGSIGVLTYTSIGGKNQEKERIEVFSGGSSIVIKDFIEFNAYNSDEKGSVLKKFDKGHKQMIIEISKKLKGQNSMLVPFSQDIEMTSITLSIIEQIHSLKQTTSNI